jgi:hypothetical protein
MPDAPDVKVKLTAEDQGVAAAIKELGNQLTTLKKKQDETATSGLSLSRAFQGIAAAAATIRLAEFGKEAFDSAVNIGKMADKTGLTTQTLSVFHHVADEVGVSTEAVDKALVRGAKSITLFEQGSKAAAAGFQMLGIKQKDFIGLKSDEKLLLVSNALGKMKAGFEKTTAAQLIFSRGGSELIPVANAIAGEGFDKITKSVSKLGLLLDRTTTDSFRVARASMKELSDAGKGVATQFEAGLLPAITDVASAFLESIDLSGKSGNGIKEIGKVAGTVVRDIAAGFIFMGTTISAEILSTELIFSEAFAEIKTRGVSVYEALGAAAHGHFAEAKAIFQNASRDIERDQAELAKQQKATWDDAAVHIRLSMEALFPSDAEEAARQRELASHIRPDIADQTDPHKVTKDTAPTDAAAKAQLAAALKQMQDELAIHKAYASQTEQVDKEMYDDGEISLAEFFDRRKTAVTADAQEEIEILRHGIVLAKAEAQKAADAELKAATPKDADKQKAAKIEALSKVAELQAKISELQINASTKVQALQTEQDTKQRASQQETLAFEKQIDELQGKKLGAAQDEIKAEAAKRTLQVQQAGGTQAEIAAHLAEIETWKRLKLAVADYDTAKAKTETDTRAFEISKKAIEIQGKAGGLSPLETEKQINALIKARLPLLQADAAAELAAAQKTGSQESVANAQNTVQQTQNLSVAQNQLGEQLKGAVTADFMSFFQTVGRNTQTMGRQFANLAGSIVQSIEQIIQKMLLQLIMTKLLKAAMGGAGGFAGGGSVGGTGGGGGFAGGGLIKGAGGPKSDSIPARVSPGEFIVKADSVSAFGVHNLEAINRGLKVPSLARLSLPEFSEGGSVGLVSAAGGSSPSNINLGIGLDKGLILQHLESKEAGRVILTHLANNPKAAGKALSRSS